MMKITITPSSNASMVSSLRTNKKEILHAGLNGVRKGIEAIYVDSQKSVPVKTGALKSSGSYNTQIEDYVVTGIVSYGNDTLNPATGKPTKDYAIDVEETHKFLANTFIDNSSSCMEIIQEEIKSVIN
nr:MAG TPA: hypothetical protein [Caudoviricetes sp.]